MSWVLLEVSGSCSCEVAREQAWVESEGAMLAVWRLDATLMHLQGPVGAKYRIGPPWARLHINYTPLGRGGLDGPEALGQRARMSRQLPPRPVRLG